MNQTKGFSLIELTVAITLMAILGGIAALSFNTIRERGKRSATTATLRTLENSIDMFHSDTNSYPTVLSDLVHRPTDAKISKKWQGPYLKKETVEDGWGSEFVYQITKGGAHPYELYSWGKNKEGSPEEEHISVWDL